MARQNKTLTVSYGAFSCTLEGFDDPVEAMKAVTDHFRALAAGDFGAGPPGSGPEALARFIEREVDRRVRAHLRAAGNDGGAAGGPAAPLTRPSGSHPAVSEPLSAERGRPSSAPLVLTSSVASPGGDDPERISPGPDAEGGTRDAAGLDEPEDGDDPNAVARLDRLRAVIDRAADPGDGLAETGQVPDSQGGDRAEILADRALSREVGEVSGKTAVAVCDGVEPGAGDADRPHAVNAGDPYGPTTRSDGYDGWAALVRDGVMPDAFVLKPGAAVVENPAQPREPADATAEEATPPARAHRSRPTADETDLSRLMSEADAKMKDPEGRERRAAISHLKAAVAAKEAARRLGEEDTAGQDDATPFRDDLDAAVRTNAAPAERGMSGGPGGAIAGRTGRPRLAPLRLVASQRIDLSDVERPVPLPGPNGARRSRLFGRDAETSAASPDAGFAAWARARGAVSLDDLMEAAAAHAIEVDGLDSFTRPQIMRKIRDARGDAGGDGSGREDELRAFGTLLRQGRFEKDGAGRFRLADGSRFGPPSRAAGG